MKMRSLLAGCLSCALMMGIVLPAAEAADASAAAAAPMKIASGTIVGIVKNPAKVAVAGATVTAAKVDGSAIRATVSLSDGIYSFADLTPGVWSITAQVDGFPDVALPSVTVDEQTAGRLKNGMQVNLPDYSEASLVKVFTSPTELLAITRRIAGTLMQPHVVIG